MCEYYCKHMYTGICILYVKILSNNYLSKIKPKGATTMKNGHSRDTGNARHKT